MDLDCHCVPACTLCTPEGSGLSLSSSLNLLNPLNPLNPIAVGTRLSLRSILHPLNPLLEPPEPLVLNPGS